MNEAEIEFKTKQEIDDLGKFENFHGITKENIRAFLVKPYLVQVDPDDLETEIRDMWVVLSPPSEMLVAFDPQQKIWAVIEPSSDENYIQVVFGASLSEALDGM